MSEIKNAAILFCVIIMAIGGGGMAASEQSEDIRPPGPDEVLIGPNGMIMPLGRILLIRKGSDYGAVKFTKFWTGKKGKTEEDRYETYESYYQDDKTGDFSNKNVRFKKDVLSSPYPRWSLFGHPMVLFGVNKQIKCGPISLWWTGRGTVYFFDRFQEEGDYGIELAPTPWTDISQVNVFDPRIKWYRYDGKRKRVIIPIDKLWEETEKKKK